MPGPAAGPRRSGARGGEVTRGDALRASLARLGPEVGEAHLRSGRVPKVTAHGMRGLHSTLAVEHGASAHVVAASLGHESSTTTIQSYVKPEAVAEAQQRRVMTVVAGGRLAS